MTLDFGNDGTFLIMGSAGLISATVILKLHIGFSSFTGHSSGLESGPLKFYIGVLLKGTMGFLQSSYN